MKIFYKKKLELLKVQICTRSSVKKWTRLRQVINLSQKLKCWNDLSMLEESLFKIYFLKLRMNNKIKFYYFSVCLFHLGKKAAFLAYFVHNFFLNQSTFERPPFGRSQRGPSTAPFPAPFDSVWRGRLIPRLERSDVNPVYPATDKTPP